MKVIEYQWLKDDLDRTTAIPKWSGKFKRIPERGEIITVTMNNLGRAVVFGSRSFEGYVGLDCLLLDPPQWWIDQNIKTLQLKDKKLSLLFGSEISYADIPLYHQYQLLDELDRLYEEKVQGWINNKS